MYRQSFCSGWMFQHGGGTTLQGMTQKSEPMEVTLPHDAMIRCERAPDMSFGNCTGYYPHENVHYTKKFHLDDASGTLFLEFEGIYMDAAIYVNGCLAGKHANGYTPFVLDISPYVTTGENTLKVVVRSGEPSSRWYPGTGIYRDVNLLRAGGLYIKPDGVQISTPQVEHDLAVISIETILVNRENAVRDVTLRHRIGEQEISAPVTMLPNETKVIVLRTEMEDPRLWSVESPNLYTCETEVTGIDHAETRFGIRSLLLDSRHGLRVNGESVKLRGGCIHHDHGVVGAIDHRALEERRIRRMKEMGYNAIRSAHFPASRTLLEVCDEVGMLVMNELCDAWTQPKVDFDYAAYFTEHWEEDCEAMVKTSFNHPSVVMYSIGNEICEVGNKFEAQRGRKIVDKIRSLDASRYITNGINIPLSILDKLPALAAKAKMDINTLMNGGLAGLAQLMATKEIVEPLEEALSYLDIAGYNYTPYRYPVDAQIHPDRIFVGSESYPAALYDNWALCEKMSQVLGDFSWTAWDYLGEAGVGKLRYGEASDFDLYGAYPWKNAWCGDFDLIGDRRPISFWREIVWGLRTAPYIAVQDPAHYGEKQSPTRWGWSDAQRRWNWRGFEEKPVIVEVYSNADEVELFCNGVVIGRTAPEKCVAKFETNYTPGTLEAVAYRNGSEISRDSLQTASYDTHIEKKDCGHGIFEISVVDAAGSLNPDADILITARPDDGVIVLGFGSADPQSEENFFDTTIKTFRGRALAVTCGEGNLTIEEFGDV